jgi:dihydroorotate dehydrogenase
MEAMDSIEQAVGRGVYTIAKMSALPAEDVRTFRQNGFGADAIDTINAIKRPMPRRNGQPALEVDVEHVGVSGPVIYKVARENLSHWSDGSGGRDYAVWSIGGVDTGYEVYHRMRSGAALVGGTQMFYRSEQPDAVAKQWAEQYKTCVVNVAQRTQR